MSTRKPHAVLITICNGDVDYVTEGTPTVVLIDWDDLRDDNLNDWMVVDIQDRIKDVKKLPADMKWREDTIRRLEAYCEKVAANTHEMAP